MSELETRIAELVGRGDLEAATHALLAGYQAEMRAYLLTLLGEPDAAADAYSLYAENVWKGLASWRREASARAWAYRVAWNAAARFHRDPWRRRRTGLPSGTASRLAEQPVSSARHSRERKLAALAELRAGLSPGEQSLLFLKVDRDLSWPEVAEAMAGEGTPPAQAALRKRYERLTRKLARLAVARGLLRRT